MEKVDKFESLLILIFLLPGFVGVLFHTAISETVKQEALDKIILALALTLVSHVVYTIISGGHVVVDQLITSTQREKALQHFASTLGWTTVIAMVLGVVWAGIHNNALLFRAAVLLGLTHRTGAIDVWHQTFSRAQPSWIRIRFKDGAMLQGWARFYSEDANPMQLFVAEATWFFPKASEGAAEDAAAPSPDRTATPLRDVFTRIAGTSDAAGETQTADSYDIVTVEGPGVLLIDFGDVRAIERLT